jgi:hypothetical protein
MGTKTMMVNCPRCGFSQPQDQYCASCGVDMLLYRPAKKALLKRVAGSTVFQVAVLGIVVLASFNFARTLRDRERALRQAEIENAQTTQVVNRRLSSESPTASELASTASSDDQGAADASDTSAAESLSAVSTAQQQNDLSGVSGAQPSTSALVEETQPRSAPVKGAETPAQGLLVTFAAVSAAGLTELMSAADTKVNAPIGPVSSAIIADVSKKLQTLNEVQAIRTLDSFTQPIKSGQTLQFDTRQRDGAASGPYISLAILPSSEGATDPQYQIHAIVALPESGGLQETSLGLPESFSIPKGSAAILFGVLPRRTTDLQAYGQSQVLRIMATKPFQENQTELLIIVQPR